MVAALLSIGVLAAILLIGAGGWLLLREPEERKRGALMVLAGVVTLGNVWLYAGMG